MSPTKLLQASVLIAQNRNVGISSMLFLDLFGASFSFSFSALRLARRSDVSLDSLSRFEKPRSLKRSNDRAGGSVRGEGSVLDADDVDVEDDVGFVVEARTLAVEGGCGAVEVADLGGDEGRLGTKSSHMSNGVGRLSFARALAFKGKAGLTKSGGAGCRSASETEDSTLSATTYCFVGCRGTSRSSLSDALL